MFPGRLADCLNVEDYRRAAKRRAHKMVFDYIDGGSDDEVTRFENHTAFRPRREIAYFTQTAKLALPKPQTP